MKNLILKFTFLLLPIFSLISCSGNDNDEILDLESIILKVSKNTISANGSDEAVITITRGLDDLTSGSIVEIIAIDGIELSTPTKLSRGATSFSIMTSGKYTLRGTYFEGETKYSKNTIEIVATEADYGKYHKKMLAMQFTSVGCTSCPALSTNIKALMSDDDYKNKLIPVSFHMNFQIADPMHLAYTETYMNYFGQQGLPAFYLDFRKDAGSTSQLSNLQNIINKIYPEESTTCGVAIDSEYDDSTRKLTITGKVISEFDNNRLKTLVYLIENDIQYAQGGYSGLEPYYHQNVVRDLLSNSYYGDKLNQVIANVEKTVIKTTTLNSSWDASNMKIVVCVMATKDGGNSYYVTNVTECAVGSSVNYIYNN